MNVSRLGTTALADSSKLGAVDAARSASVRAEGAATSGGTLSLSRRAHFTSKLLEMARSDPAKAKQMVSDLASAMRDRAASGSGSAATRWSGLADQLQKAADTGDYSALLGGPGRAAASSAAQAYVTRSSR